MSEKQETVSPVIPEDYCIIQLKVVEEDITEIGISKVINNLPVTLYFTEINSNTGSLEKILPIILDIIGTDTIFYINTETEIELLKNKCESMQIPIINELLNAKEIMKRIETSQKYFVCNYLELKLKM